MADQDNRAAHGVDGGLRVLLVVGVRSLWRLRNRYRVAVLLKDLCDGVPAGPIGECPMHQNHVFDGSLRRGTCRGSVQSRAHQQSDDCNPVSLLHDHCPLWFELQRIVHQASNLQWTISGTSTTLLKTRTTFVKSCCKCGVMAGRKTTFGLSSMRRL